MPPVHRLVPLLRRSAALAAATAVLAVPAAAGAASDPQIATAVDRAADWIAGRQLASGALGPNGGLDPSWALIGLAGSGRHAADLRTTPGAASAQDYYLNLWTRTPDAQWSSLGTPAATDYERAILVGRSAGLDPTRLSASRNMLADLAGFYRPETGSFAPAGLVNHQIFALQALLVLPVAPALVARTAETLADAAVDGAGVWRIPDVDLTGAAVGALCGAGRTPADPVVAAGIAKLRGAGGANSSSTAWGIDGLAMCGIARGGPAWTSGDEQAVDRILAAQLSSGPDAGAWPYSGSTGNLYTTQDALRALVAPGFSVAPPARANPSDPAVRPVPAVADGTPVPVTLSVDVGDPAGLRFCRVVVPSGSPLASVLAEARRTAAPAGCVTGWTVADGRLKTVNGRYSDDPAGGWRSAIDRGPETTDAATPVRFGASVALTLARPAAGRVDDDPTPPTGEPGLPTGGPGDPPVVPLPGIAPPLVPDVRPKARAPRPTTAPLRASCRVTDQRRRAVRCVVRRGTARSAPRLAATTTLRLTRSGRTTARGTVARLHSARRLPRGRYVLVVREPKRTTRLRVVLR